MDKEYQALLENYEDAMMRLVMYRVAQEDGKKLLEEAEQLEADGFEVPKELDEKCLKLIRDASAGRKPKQFLNKTNAQTGRTRSHPRLRMVGRVALAAVLAATLMFTVAYAASPEFRAGVLSFFTKVEEIGTYFFFQSEGSASPVPQASSSLTIKDGIPFEFTYVPEGYELFLKEAYDQGVNGTIYQCTYYYPNDSPNNFDFQVAPILEGEGLFVDTEDATITSVKIRGYDGQLIQKTDAISGRECITYLWFDLVNELEFCYSSVGVPHNESQKIFDGIVIFQQN